MFWATQTHGMISGSTLIQSSSTLINTSTSLTSSWIAIDPGGAAMDRSHLESSFEKVVAELGISVEAAVTFQVEDAWRREAVAYFAPAVTPEQHAHLRDLFLNQISYRGTDLHDSNVLSEIAAGEHGRYFIFRNQLSSNKVQVDELLLKTGIQKVIAIGDEITTEDVIVTDDFLRPIGYQGAVTLLVERIYTGEFAPIEKRNPHKCCGDDH